MILRRVFYYWQFVAVAALPLWLMIAASIFGDSAWQVLGAKEVRLNKAVSWADVGVLTLWHALIVLMGVFSETASWLAVLVVLVGIGSFWFAGWELYAAARRRVREALAYIDETARFGSVPTGPTGFTPVGDPAAGRSNPAGRAPVDPSVIIIQENPEER